MSIHRRENQYQGVNAHLNSFLLHKSGGWQAFHTEHIGDLRRFVDNALPAGYYVLADQSLQLSEYAPLSIGVIEETSSTRPDVAIYRSTSAPTFTQSGVMPSAPIATLPLPETLSDQDFLSSLVIYRTESDETMTPVTRIELLSPANKPGGSHYTRYVTKRDETLASGICVVEVDYIHETRSPIPGIPSYPKGEPGAYPYTILVSNPHPDLSHGQMTIYGWYVDHVIPSVLVPLMGKDDFVFDFNAVYDFTYAQNKYYGDIVVDYAQKPVRFETYSLDDQRRIEARMAAVAQTQQPST